jgi:hypothetical protein
MGDLETLDFYNSLDKERLIVSGVIACNNEINKLIHKSRIFESLIESDKLDIYKYNMMNLYSSVINTDFLSLNESFINESFSYIKNDHDNYYAYFNKMNSFLSGYENSVQNSLNESLETSSNLIKTPIQLNINTFKEDLKSIISKLESINEVKNLSNDVLKIKTLSRIPTYVFGYNIMNNEKLEPTLEEFGLEPKNIKMIVYDASNKGISFVTNGGFIFYDLKTDTFTQNKHNFPIDGMLFERFKQFTGINNLIQLYFDLSILKLKYTNNLYNDEKYKQWLADREKKSNVFK